MNCERAEELFVDYMAGEISRTDAESLQAHLDECPKCAGKLAEMIRVREMVGQLSHPEPSPMAVNRVLAVAREEASVHILPLSCPEGSCKGFYRIFHV